ncbi:MAG: 1-pyrroline-5-carboxylate dehydrogenase, partial [Acidobacteriota bacterium]
MHNGIFRVPSPSNEPVLSYAPGTAERAELRAALESWRSELREIPCIIGGRRVRSGKLTDQRVPHRHREVIARYYQAGPSQVRAASRAASEAWHSWSR